MGYDAFSKCHPLVNFLYFVGAIGFGVVIQHPAYILASFLGGFLYYLVLKGKNAWKLTVLLLPMFLILSALNPLFNHYGNRIFFYVFGNPYTLEALLYGMAIAGIFAVMMVWFCCYSVVLTSDKFICLFGSLIPAISMLLVMVLRLIPELMRKASQISFARRTIGRGAGEQSSTREKVQDSMRILSALTDWALEGSIMTADSMRSRGYGCARRTSFRIYRITMRDVVLLAVMAVLAGLVLVAGGNAATYTPELSIAVPGWGLAVYSIYLLIPTALQAKEALQWHISISRI